LHYRTAYSFTRFVLWLFHCQPHSQRFNGTRWDPGSKTTGTQERNKGMIPMLQQHTALRAASLGTHPDHGLRNDLQGIACPSLTVLECLSMYGSPQHHIPTARGSLRHNCPWTEVCCNPCNLTCLRTHLYPPPCPTHRCPTHTELRCVRTVHLSPLRPRQQMRGLRPFTVHTELCDTLHHQRCVRIPCSQCTRPLHRMRPCKSRARPWLAALLYRV
jgi:hypothetical protein